MSVWRTMCTASSGDDDAEDPPSSTAHLIRAFQSDAPTALPRRFELTPFTTAIIGRTDGAEHDRLNIPADDTHVSREHAELVKMFGRFAVRDLGSKNGTRLNGALLTGEQPTLLTDGDVIQVGHTFFVHRADQPATAPALLLQTANPALAELYAAVARVAPSPLALLITGESGTGKELLARAVHAASGRAGAFVAINCGALPEGLIEGELFGSRRGAFSGAIEDRAGLVRAAAGGTLFLDEIGDLPLRAQATLLRVLQEREVLPLGETRPVPVDFRVVAATHRELRALVAEEIFRADLLSRLAGFTIELPPLRERREDLGLIIAAILERHAPLRAASTTFRASAASELFRHTWPGNIRELEQTLVRALAFAGNGELRGEHLRLHHEISKPTAPSPRNEHKRPLRKSDHERREKLVTLLEQHRGNVAAVARALGEARTQVRRWIDRYEIQL